MQTNDPLIRLLQSADTATDALRPRPDLAASVHTRHTQCQTRSRQIKLALTPAASIALLASIALHDSNRLTPDSRPLTPELAGATAGLSSSVSDNLRDLVLLRSRADALAAEADALQRQIQLAQTEQSRQDLREAYRLQLTANAQADTTESATDRAALIALSQGDYYWEIVAARQPAQAAYQSVLNNFPKSHWAALAQERLNEIQMN